MDTENDRIKEHIERKHKIRQDGSKSVFNDSLFMERRIIDALLRGSKATESMGLEIVAKASDICPKHYDKFVEIFLKYHNINCGLLHRMVEEKLNIK